MIFLIIKTIFLILMEQFVILEGIISSLKKSIHDVTSLSFELNGEIIGPPLKEIITCILPNEKPKTIENVILILEKL